MEIRRKMINQRYMTVSPRGFNSNSVSPRGFNCLSVSPCGLNSFLILLMMTFCFSGFSQTERNNDVIINKNSKITFSGFQLNKTQPYPSYKQYEVVAPAQSNDWKILGNSGTNQLSNFLGTTDNIGLSFRTNNAIRQTITNTGEIGIGTITPTSTLHVIGSVAETVTVITATTSLNATHNKIVLNNGAANIVITLPDALTCIGRKYEFTRYAGSTGAVGIIPAAGQIQALAGTVGATTTLGLHSAAGAGLKHTFTAVNIGGVGVWVRL